MSVSMSFRVFLVSSLLWLVASPIALLADDPETNDRRPIDAERGNGFVEPKPGSPIRHPAAGWYLGVYGKYTSTGLLLTEVTPNTAASRFGLEVGDRIVAVNGQQIGVLENSQLNLDVALQRHAGRSGIVRLLVQDHRTMQLINIKVQLSRGRVHT